MPTHANRRFVSTDDDKLLVREITDGNVVASLDCPFGKIMQAAISRRGDRVAAFGGGRCVLLWHPETNLRIPLFVGVANVRELIFTTDGDWLISATDDGIARVWDANTGELRRTLRHQGSVLDVDVSSDGRFFVVVTDQGEAHLWPLENLQDALEVVPDPQRIALPEVPVHSARFLADGIRVVCYSEGDSKEILIWNLEQAAIESRTPVRGKCHVAVHPEINEVAIATSEMGVVLWNLVEQSKTELTKEPRTHCAYSPDGQRVFATSEVPYLPAFSVPDQVEFPPTVVDVWDRDDQAKPQQRELPFGRVHNFFVAGEGAVFVNLDHRFGLAIHAADSRQPIVTLPGHLATVTDLAFTGDRDHLVSVSADRRAILWDLRDPGQSRVLVAHDAAITRLAISEDNGVLLTGDRAGQVIRWDFETGEILGRWQVGEDAVRQLEIHPQESQFLATTEEGGFSVHDFEGDQPVSLQINASRFAWAEYAPDGSSVLLIPDEVTKLMDLAAPPPENTKGNRVLVVELDGSAIFNFEFESPVVTSHYDSTSLRLITLTRDGSVSIHAIQSRELMMKFSCAASAPRGAVADASGQYVAVACKDQIEVVRAADGAAWMTLDWQHPPSPTDHRFDPFCGNRLFYCRPDHRFRAVPLRPVDRAKQFLNRKLTSDEKTEFGVPSAPASPASEPTGSGEL